MRKKFKTIDEAEEAFGLTLEFYLESESGKENAPAVETEKEQRQESLDGIPDKVMMLIAKLTTNQLSALVLLIINHLAVPDMHCTLKKVLPLVLPSMCFRCS